MRLEGWHIIVVIGFVLVLAVLAGIVLVIAAARRGTRARADGDTGRGSSGARSPAETSTKEQRLRELDDLRRRGVIAEDEYGEARRKILDS